MEQTIIKHIEEELASEEIDGGLEATDDLLGGGILDSLGMMKLITFIEETFNIEVAPEDMVIENFMTVENICEYISSKG
ncbi:phosphopantetheine-containing protein [Algibacter marinivivus]|uniref:Phosphopantetheine-containing protein n=1 Tax=Algibacter marinivivus TaxID=2100723 RepID=A0A2U2X448_9FLAO|nr:acyl carrier protein [Algibacter marinivivus]PWH82539.1 phosphopantetheine-containing protein [Algibacter marinivivus]